MKLKKRSLIDICAKNITVYNYDASTEELAKMVYRYLRIDLDTVKALDLVLGTKKIPKWLSVLRRVQKRKKEILQEIYDRQLVNY